MYVPRLPPAWRTPINLALIGVVVVAWCFTFRPQRLGGPAEFLGVSGASMTPTLRDGDLVILHKEDHYSRGDIIGYRIPGGQPGAGAGIIHRIVAGNGTVGFVTRGDHNPSNDPFWRPRAHDAVGRVWIRIPHGVAMVRALRGPLGVSVLVTLVTFLVAARALRPHAPADGEQAEQRDNAPDPGFA
jgi:signal peptidase I